MLQKLKVEDLELGMFVEKVTKQQGSVRIKTKGWVRTENAKQALIKKGVLEVAIDPDKRLPTEEEEQASVPEVQEDNSAAERRQSTTFEAEIEQAEGLYQEAKGIQNQMLKAVKAGRPINMEPIKKCTGAFIDSVFRNPDALTCMSRIRTKDAYLLEHSLNVSILMAILGKQMELEEEVINDLALGAFLHDIGKVLVPEEILHKPGRLTEEEYDIMKGHVTKGIEILEKTPGIPKLSMEVMMHHHERLDGGGYPFGHDASKLSTYAKMIAIVDTYDAITADRCYSKGKPSNVAFAILMKDKHCFEPEIVQHLIKAIGVHPVGTVVKLKSDRLAIVTKTNNTELLKPTITTFYHIKNKHYTDLKRINLASGAGSEQIESSVRPDEFKINFDKFMKEVFLKSFTA